MGIFARAVITGFGFSLGAALFKRLSKQLGLDEDTETDTQPHHGVEASADEGGGEPAQAH